MYLSAGVQSKYFSDIKKKLIKEVINKTFSLTGFGWKIEDIFTQLKRFFNHPNEKQIESGPVSELKRRRQSVFYSTCF